MDRLKVAYADDSAMILDSATAPAGVAAIPFLKNAFVVVAATERGDLAKSVGRLSQGLRRDQFRSLPERSDRFRLMAHLDGGLVPIEQRARAALERSVARHTGARVEPRGMGQEYWVVGRQGPAGAAVLRPAAQGAAEADAQGGAGVRAGGDAGRRVEPTPEDRFLDPFGGSGALVVARAELPARSLAYSDLDLEPHRRALTAQLPKRVACSPRMR